MKDKLTRGDKIICHSLDDQRTWQELLEQKGYNFTTDPSRHVITILEEPKCVGQ